MNEIHDFYEKNGYYVARGLFSPAELQPLERDFDRIVAQLMSNREEANARWEGPEMDRLGAGKTVVLHTHNVQQFSGAWMQAMMHEKFLDATQSLIGPDIILHHSKLFQKPAEKGAPFPMHQDWTYFPTIK